MSIIYTSENKIFRYDEDKKSLTEIPCGRISKYRETLRSIEKRKEWKTTGSGASFMGITSAEIDAEAMPVNISGIGVCRGELVYAVNLEDVGSVYHRSFDPSDDCEGLVRASNDFVFGSFDCDGDKLAVSMGASPASLHIAVMDIGGGYNEYTDGDTIEENPCWSKKRGGIYFSTAGYARNSYGSVAATGPRSIAYLDTVRSEMSEIVSDERYDYLHPKEDENGILYCIRQPYGGEKPKSDITVKDIFLFPYRLIKGLFGFLNVFTTLFGGESLKTGGASMYGTKSKQRSEKDMIIEGNIINAEKLDKINEADDGAHIGIMPMSRVLIKRSADGSEEVLYKGVLDFIPEADGAVIVSNGRHLIRISPDGTQTHIAKAKLAEHLTICN